MPIPCERYCSNLLEDSAGTRHLRHRPGRSSALPTRSPTTGRALAGLRGAAGPGALVTPTDRPMKAYRGMVPAREQRLRRAGSSTSVLLRRDDRCRRCGGLGDSDIADCMTAFSVITRAMRATSGSRSLASLLRPRRRSTTAPRPRGAARGSEGKKAAPRRRGFARPRLVLAWPATELAGASRLPRFLAIPILGHLRLCVPLSPGQVRGTSTSSRSAMSLMSVSWPRNVGCFAGGTISLFRSSTASLLITRRGLSPPAR